MSRGSDRLFRALGLDGRDAVSLRSFCKGTGIAPSELRSANDEGVLPSGRLLGRILAATGLSAEKLMLRMGVLDHSLLQRLCEHADEISEILADRDGESPLCPLAQGAPTMRPDFETELGKLYRGDCLEVLPVIESDSVDLAFADPPFNLKKLYPSRIDDDLREAQYVSWCQDWLGELIRVLKPGGSLFVWNLPKWNSILAKFLDERLTFRHWIAVDIKYCLPIAGRLYPSHYSLLYYCKGRKPSVFNPDRLPMEICPKCRADLRDYGGYKHKMNPDGVNLCDVWRDISPVRHARYKKRKGANELPLKLMDRVVTLASQPGQLVLDPFGGAGTTYVAAELKSRRWTGIEIGPLDDIVERFSNIDEDDLHLRRIREQANHLFTAEDLRERKRQGLWTPESARRKHTQRCQEANQPALFDH